MKSKKGSQRTPNLKRLHEGNFNYMGQETQPDGSIIITLTKDGEPRSYRFRVQNLYQEGEREVALDEG